MAENTASTKYVLYLFHAPKSAPIQVWSTSPFGSYARDQQFVVGAAKLKVTDVLHRVFLDRERSLIIETSLLLSPGTQALTQAEMDQLWVDEGGTGPVVPWPW